MSRQAKISLATAILTNINIMAGAGIFINMVLLTKLTQTSSCLIYLLVGLFMLPLIKSIATLVKKYPLGGFYAFAKPVSPLLGFVSCWTYFFSKLASTSLVLYVSAVFLKQLAPQFFAFIPELGLSIVILAIFTYLNLFNIELGSYIQKFFFTAKAIPILLIICLGIYELPNFQLNLQLPNVDNISTAIPLALYCLAGFEAACSLSRKIKNPEKNGPIAIFYSFFIIIGVYSIFQLLVSGMLLKNINQVQSYDDAFPYFASLITSSKTISSKISNFFNLFIIISTLGGAYGMLFANPWNLYTLAEHKHTFNADLITTCNKHDIPTVAIIIQSLICLSYLLLTQGNQLPLQQTAALGVTIAYTISIITILIKKPRQSLIPWLALITCSIFITSCLSSILTHSLTSLTIFFAMLSFGIVMYFTTSKK